MAIIRWSSIFCTTVSYTHLDVYKRQGLRTLSIIKDAVANVKSVHGIDVDIDAIPLDDAATYEVRFLFNYYGLFYDYVCFNHYRLLLPLVIIPLTLNIGRLTALRI